LDPLVSATADIGFTGVKGKAVVDPFPDGCRRIQLVGERTRLPLTLPPMAPSMDPFPDSCRRIQLVGERTRLPPMAPSIYGLSDSCRRVQITAETIWVRRLLRLRIALQRLRIARAGISKTVMTTVRIIFSLLMLQVVEWFFKVAIDVASRVQRVRRDMPHSLYYSLLSR